MATGTTGAPGNIPYPLGSDQYALTSDLAGMASQANLALAAAATNIAEVAEGRSPVGHTHLIGNVTGLQTALDGKAPSVHTHPVTDISVLDLTDEHLDTLAEPVNFRQTSDARATVEKGYPPVTPGLTGTLAGAGTVRRWAGTNAGLIMTYQPRSGLPSWRVRNQGTWGAWQTYATAGHTHTWEAVTNKPAAFTPTSHTHSIGNVTGLQAALDAAGTEPDWTAAIAALNTAAA